MTIKGTESEIYLDNAKNEMRGKISKLLNLLELISLGDPGDE
jgi:hypothetical protein